MNIKDQVSCREFSDMELQAYHAYEVQSKLAHLFNVPIMEVTTMAYATIIKNLFNHGH